MINNNVELNDFWLKIGFVNIELCICEFIDNFECL